MNAAETAAAHDALLVGVEAGLFDHSAELAGPNVDPNLAELAHRYLAMVGDKALAEIRDAMELPGNGTRMEQA